MAPEFNYFDESANALGPIAEFAAQTAKPAPKTIFEAAADGVDSGAIADFAAQQLRSQAMATVLNWSEQGDYSFQALSDAVVAMNDMDGVDDEAAESTDEEDQEFTDLLTAVGYAFIALGADSSNVQAFIENESDEEGAKLGAFLSPKLSDVTDDDETIIVNYAVGGDLVMESMIRVIRGGQLAFKKKRIGRPHKMTSLQRAGLKKARSKAFTGAARMARKKSMRIRMKRGL